ETCYGNQSVSVGRPGTTTQQVTEYCMQPSTRYVSVVAGRRCGLCGHPRAACGCTTVALTCYTPVPVVREVPVTTFVPEVQTRQVPVTSCRLVREVKTVEVPFTTCQLVREVVTERIPCTTFRCEPRTVTRQIPHPGGERAPAPCAAPATRLAPCPPPGAAAPQALPTSQSAPPPSGQAEASRQG